jgi:hypothetical protein
MLWIPSIPLVGFNLIVASSQVGILFVEGEHMQEQAYPLMEVV